MSAVVLAGMSPAQRQGWEVLLDLGFDRPVERWCLLGGQMVWLLACQQGVQPPRATEDIDVVVDIRADQRGLRRFCGWLEHNDFALDGMSAEGVGHRYVRPAVPGPGRVMFDVLAPDNVGDRADQTTTPPARTLSVPGGRAALDDAEQISVVLDGRAGSVPCPGVLAAILVKASATTIPVRANPERDWVDVAFLLTLVSDPIGSAGDLTKSRRKKLRVVADLQDDQHPAWRTVGTRAGLGQVALRFLLDEWSQPSAIR